ncbi:MAG: galactokinase family protein [Asgard group archaeon]|nr:galactokinase family protein [Asgard group archaeon]
MLTNKNYKIVAPGRVFLFGEHSDYLGLDVIAMAINRNLTINIEPTNNEFFEINYLDLEEKDNFPKNEILTYRHSRDYVRSAYNVLLRQDIIPKRSAKMTISSDIPIASGLSSSSALSVAAILAFSSLAGTPLTKKEIVGYAFEAEVKEFGESGGKMDHFASVYGGIIHVTFQQQIELQEINLNLSDFVIGDSKEKKADTVETIKYIRTMVEKGYQLLSKEILSFNHRTTSLKEVNEHIDKLPKTVQKLTLASLKNRDITKKALIFLQSNNFSAQKFGSLLNQHHEILRNDFSRSTKKIERMIQAAKQAGALGCKINGSGGGGTMVAYAPEKVENVIEAIENVGGKAFIVTQSNGASIVC